MSLALAGSSWQALVRIVSADEKYPVVDWRGRGKNAIRPAGVVSPSACTETCPALADCDCYSRCLPRPASLGSAEADAAGPSSIGIPCPNDRHHSPVKCIS